MATKTIAIAVQIEGDAQLRQLQANFDQVSNARKALNKSERDGLITSKQASKQRADLNVQLKANRNALTDHQNALLKNNNALKKNSGFVAGVRKGMGQWAISMIGITAAIAGVTKLVGSAAKIFKDFEKANSKLQSVLGATSDEMKKLKFQAKELGSVTSFTASQVAELQTEFAKLGFPTSDIINMTESTLDAAAAMGAGLGEQAALTGATIKAFGLTSKDAAKVNDVLAKSTSRSALDFSKLNASMSTIAPVASKLGFGLEDTVSLLGNLSDSGFDASTAATATRNIMLKLADSSSVLGKRLNEPVKDLPSLVKGLNQLKNEGVDLSEALELTDVRSVAAFSTFLSGTDSLEKLSDELNNANGAAKEMADTMLDNLAGDTDKAKSAWEGFVLSVESGDGKISKGLRSVVQAFSGVLNGLTKLNRTLKEVQLGKLSHQFKVFADTGKQAAKDVVSDFKKAGIEGDNLTAAIERATVRAKENYKQAKARKDLNMSISYFEEWKALKELLNPTEKNTEETDAELTDKEKNAIRKKAELRAAEKKAAEQRIEDVENIESKGLSDDDLTAIGEGEDLKNQLLIEKQKELNEMTLAEKMLFLAEQGRITGEALNTEIEQDAAAQEMKKAARMDFLRTAASVFSGLAGLAKKGSDEFKALALADIAANTAIGFVQALNIAQKSAAATGPAAAFAFPIFYASQIAAVLGAASQAKSVLSTKAARGMLLEDGGMINGNSHANGGVPFSVDGQLGFEAEGGEAIINKRSTQMFAPLLSAINEAGGGVAFERGGRLTKFQGGGALPSNVGVTASQQGFASGSLDLEEFSSAIVDGINDKTVINVATSTTDTATEVLNIASEASF